MALLWYNNAEHIIFWVKESKYTISSITRITVNKRREKYFPYWSLSKAFFSITLSIDFIYLRFVFYVITFIFYVFKEFFISFPWTLSDFPDTAPF